MRSWTTFLLVSCVVAAACLGVVSAGDPSADWCRPSDQSAIRVSFLLQGSGANVNTQERRTQWAFANSIIAGVTQLNNANPYPGFQSQMQSYTNNVGSIQGYSNVAQVYPADPNSILMTSADSFNSNSWSFYQPGTPDLVGALQTILNIGLTANTLSDPQTSMMKVLVVVNDGLAWSNTGDATSDDVSAIDQHFEDARCRATDLAQRGTHVIWVHSNKNSFPAQKPIASLASHESLDIPFDDWSDLMTERVLHQVASAIRNLASPGRASGSACVVSGNSHLTTFDGLHLDYQGSGDYWLFRSLRIQDNIAVQYRAGPCATSATCVLGAAITDGRHTLEAVIADRTGNFRNAYLSLDGQRLPLADYVSNDDLGFGGALFNVSVNLLGSESYQVTIRLAGNVLTIQEHLITFLAAPHLFGRSTGLCGNWNGCPLDDLLDSCGKVGAVNTSDPAAAARFGDSWTVPAGESLFSTAPPQGVSAWEVSNNVVCPFDPIKLVASNSYTRWPFIPAVPREPSSGQGSTVGIAQFPTPNIDAPNAANNNLGLVSLKATKLFTAFQVAPQCARMRGALLQDCVADAATSSGSIVGSVELLWQACAAYCTGGRSFTNLVTPSDCIAAQICSRGSSVPDLHQNYGGANGTLPAVSFGNPNVPN